MQSLSPSQLKAYRLPAVGIPGWETRRTSSLGFAPVGQMAHHTAGRDSLRLIIDKKLVQYHIPKNGTLNVVSVNRTAHPGIGNRSVLERVRAGLPPINEATTGQGLPRAAKPGTTRGYRWFVGYEVENLGDGADPYTPAQIDTLVGAMAAHCVEYRWSPDSCIHHREWTSRKIDMSWPGDLRAMVARRVEEYRAEMALPGLEDEDMVIVKDRGSVAAFWLHNGAPVGGYFGFYRDQGIKVISLPHDDFEKARTDVMNGQPAGGGPTSFPDFTISGTAKPR